MEKEHKNVSFLNKEETKIILKKLDYTLLVCRHWKLRFQQPLSKLTQASLYLEQREKKDSERSLAVLVFVGMNGQVTQVHVNSSNIEKDGLLVFSYSLSLYL